MRISRGEDAQQVSRSIKEVWNATSHLIENRLELFRLDIEERIGLASKLVVFLLAAVFFVSFGWFFLCSALFFGAAMYWGNVVAGVVVAGVNFLFCAGLLWAAAKNRPLQEPIEGVPEPEKAGLESQHYSHASSTSHAAQGKPL